MSKRFSVETRELNFFYGDVQSLFDVCISIPAGQVTALIGPSGCGKSTFLITLNRMDQQVEGARITGEVRVEEFDVLNPSLDFSTLRRRVGMVFQKSSPFPKTIFENVAYGLRIRGEKNKTLIAESVEKALCLAGLWEEVKDRLGERGLELSGGQQQRLCIARALAVEPTVILMDEPCSALDPQSTAKVEECVRGLAEAGLTVVIVTHNMQQAQRVSLQTAFFYAGKIVEFGTTEQIFTSPKEKRTEDYVTGRFG